MSSSAPFTSLTCLVLCMTLCISIAYIGVTSHFFDISFADNQDEKYYEEMQTKINDLSLLLFDKLEFLEVSKKGLTNFQVMFIALEVRLSFILISSHKTSIFRSVQQTLGHREIVIVLRIIGFESISGEA